MGEIRINEWYSRQVSRLCNSIVLYYHTFKKVDEDYCRMVFVPPAPSRLLACVRARDSSASIGKGEILPEFEIRRVPTFFTIAYESRTCRMHIGLL
jgi:hypothetical protein